MMVLAFVLWCCCVAQLGVVPVLAASWGRAWGFWFMAVLIVSGPWMLAAPGWAAVASLEQVAAPGRGVATLVLVLGSLLALLPLWVLLAAGRAPRPGARHRSLRPLVLRHRGARRRAVARA